jgi:hypothetical protein
MFFTIPNLVSNATSEISGPWDLPPTDRIPDKATWNQPTTSYCFYSAYEGVNAKLRVSDKENNPPYRVHSLVADYDSPQTEETFAMIWKKDMTTPPFRYHPNYVCQTHSGNIRMVWSLERPVILPGFKATVNFLRLARKYMAASKWAPGLDEGAWDDPCRFFAQGKGWKKLSDHVIPAGIIEDLIYKANKGVRLTGEIKIPMDVLAKESESRFPGRFQGRWEDGARCNVFWEAEGKNPTSCIIHTDGIMSFSRKGFYTWTDIFGREFVAQYEGDKLAKVREMYLTDSKGDFWKQVDGKWICMSAAVVARELRCSGFDGKISKGQTASEIDHILSALTATNRVEKAFPFVHNPPGRIFHDGVAYLNTSLRSCMKPSEAAEVDPDRDFPWVKKFLWNFFDTDETGADPMPFFLGWLKHFYANGLAQQPRQGQAVVIAGPSSVGKTLLTRAVIGRIVGGASDASRFLVENDSFSDTEVSMPLMCIDDQTATVDARTRMRFSTSLKKLVASRTVVFNGKYMARGEIPWLGRVTVTCNMDPESLRILPDMDISTIDKISLFKAREPTDPFPDSRALDMILDRELPYFCAWLLRWEIPEDVMNRADTRYFVRAYHHAELLSIADQGSSTHSIIDLVQDFLEDQAKDGETYWKGNATALYQCLDLRAPSIMRKTTVQVLGSTINRMIRQGHDITMHKVGGRTRYKFLLPTPIKGGTKDE